MAAKDIDSLDFTNKRFLRRLTESGVQVYTFSFSAVEDDGSTDHMTEDGDVRRIIRVEEGIRILGAFLRTEGMDTNASAAGVWDLNINDGTTSTTILDALAAGNSGAITQKGSLGNGGLATEVGTNYEVPAPAAGAKYVLEVECITAPATAVADGSGTFDGFILYTNNDR